jgi:D-amino-acid dehydrogenase
VPDRGADVVVIGGGPVGACVALELARAGAGVTLLEREESICPAASGAHANCGLIVPSDVRPLAQPGVLGQGLRWLTDGSSPFYIAPRPSPSLLRWLWLFRAACHPERADAAMPLLRSLHVASAHLHGELGREHGRRWGYHQCGVVQAYESQAGFDAAVAHAAVVAALGVRAEPLSAVDVGERFPASAGRLAGAVLYPDDGHLDPMLFTREVAALAGQAGADVRTGCEALALDGDGAGAARVITTRGDLVAGQVVIASGAWSPFLARDAGLRLPIEPAKGYSVDVARPAAFPELPLYLGEAHVVLTPLGDALRIGSTLELAGWDMTVRRRRLQALGRAAQRVLGLPADGPVRQVWRGPRPVTPDGLPVIGRAPRRGNVIVATGHCMLGLSLAPVTGRLVAELAGGAPPSQDLRPLAPGRFSRL